MRVSDGVPPLLRVRLLPFSHDEHQGVLCDSFPVLCQLLFNQYACVDSARQMPPPEPICQVVVDRSDYTEQMQIHFNVTLPKVCRE